MSQCLTFKNEISLGSFGLIFNHNLFILFVKVHFF